MGRHHSQPQTRSERVAGFASLNGLHFFLTACTQNAMAAGGPVPEVAARPPVQQVSWYVLKPHGPASGTLTCWIRRFLNPNDLVGLKGMLLLAIFLAGGLLGGA